MGLLTTINSTHDRVAMHATRRAVLEAQAEAVGLPLLTIPLPWPCPNGVYEERMRAAVEAARGDGVTHLAFGDLFLEEIRAYRERQMEGTGLRPLFPLWGEPTGPLARTMVDAGLRAVLTCVDPQRLPGDFVGRVFDHRLLDELPADVDPCGENGEFHTCVLDAPCFSAPLLAATGEVVVRDGFHFADVVLR